MSESTQFYHRPGFRMFLQSVIIQGTAAAALFTGRMDGNTFIGASALALSIYGLASARDKQIAAGKP